MRPRQHSPLTDKGQAKTRVFFFFGKGTKEVIFKNRKTWCIIPAEQRFQRQSHNQ